MRALDLLIFGGDDCCKIPITLIDQPGAGFQSVSEGLHLDYLCPALPLSSSIAVTNFGVWFLQQFLDTRFKLMQNVHPSVVANRRTKIAERFCKTPSPIWSRGSVPAHRSQHSQQI